MKMKWASRVSDNESFDTAVEECVSGTKETMGSTPPDLVVAFVSSSFASEYDLVPSAIIEHFGPTLLFGCSGGGVIGGGKEIEHRPSVSLTAAHLPDVKLTPLYLEGEKLPDLDAGPEAWHEALDISPENDPSFLLLVDPFSFPAQNLIMGLDYAFPKSVKIGGMASDGRRQGENALFLGGKAYRSGAIGIALYGNIIVDTVVAQGCRPIGELMCVTKNKQNVLLELDDKPPLEILQDIFSASSERDRELMRHSLFLGIVMDDFNDDPGQGDFLIRNIIGLDSNAGVMAIGEMLREGQRVQFHLRDALTSAEDLAVLLSRYSSETQATDGEGALLFSCLGRGEHLYGRPDHDSDLFRDKIGTIPLGGFFCNGEIGPVGGTTFLHGYTSSFGIFRSAES